jgi:4-alpha-glucanotransferase
MVGWAPHVPPFPSEYRASGLLLHVTSLPSPYGIGDLGSSAFSWIDRLHDAGQRWWQALPLGPTGYGNSPYQSMSSFAGNALLISPDSLISDGLIQASDAESHFSADAVDYDIRHPVQTAAARKGVGKLQSRERSDSDLGACLRRVLRQASALAGRLRSVPRAERKVSRSLLSGVAGRVGSAHPRVLSPRRGES